MFRDFFYVFTNPLGSYFLDKNDKQFVWSRIGVIFYEP